MTPGYRCSEVSLLSHAAYLREIWGFLGAVRQGLRQYRRRPVAGADARRKRRHKS
jgi:hypothetical protein